MALETVTWLGDYVNSNPTNQDQKRFGDDHFRNMKTGAKASFAGWPGAILMTGTEAQGATVNDFVLTISPAPPAYTTGVVLFKATHTNTGAATLQINALTAKTLKDPEGGALAAGDIPSGAVVIAYYDGTDFLVVSCSDRAARHDETYTGAHDFTGAVLTMAKQALGDNTTKGASTSFVFEGLALKADIASPTFTGIPRGPTASFGESGTQLATLDFVIASGLSASLPGQTGKNKHLLTTDGTNGSWTNTIDGSVVTLLTGGAFVGTTEAQLLTNKRLAAPVFADSSDDTKRANVVLSGITAGQNRSITIADEDMTLFTPMVRLLLTVTASNSATVDLEGVFDDTYDEYEIVADNITVATGGAISTRFKIGGAYITSSTYGSIGFSNTTTQSNKVFDDLGNAAGVNAHFIAHLQNPEKTGIYHVLFFQGIAGQAGVTNGTPAYFTNAGVYNNTTGALTGIRFYSDAGNVLTGTFRVFGIRKV